MHDNNMNSELVVTEDGSHSLYVAEINECYHSTHGAVQESSHIFIETGLNHCSKSDIDVLEIGFGTGLNAFLTLINAEQTNRKIRYVSLEKYPVKLEKALLLNYADKYSDKLKIYFEQLHSSAWNTKIQISPFFCLEKIDADFTNYEFSKKYDLIYFDAFSPEKQPEMWSQDLFVKIATHCNPGAILATYCAKGDVRRALKSAGFDVERLAGPPGKREILRAVLATKNK